MVSASPAGSVGSSRSWAVELGQDVVRLDTNRALTNAIEMYRAAGYTDIERYNDNPYADFWFEKRLTS